MEPIFLNQRQRRENPKIVGWEGGIFHFNFHSHGNWHCFGVIHIVYTHKNRIFYVFTLPPPNKFLFRFKFSSITISRLFSFLLVSEVQFHQTNIKKISMVLYTIINGNVIASFLQKRKVLRFCGPKKNFFVRTQPWTQFSLLTFVVFFKCRNKQDFWIFGGKTQKRGEIFKRAGQPTLNETVVQR